MSHDRIIEPDIASILSVLGVNTFDRAERVTGGVDAAIWRVECDGQSFALRLLRPEQLGQMNREVAALTAAARAAVPVPAVVTSGIWQDRPAMLLSWSPGVSLERALLKNRFNPLAIRSLAIEFGETLAKIHRVEPPPEVENHPVSWQRWAGQEPALDRCLNGIETKPAKLIHLDYHPLNLLVVGTKISAVLDWANARVGDPRADIARSTTILRLAPLPSGVRGFIAPTLIWWFERCWRSRYEQIAGPIRDIAPFMWWAGAVSERDLAPRLGRPDLPWLTPAYFERIQSWIRRWQERSLAG